MDLYFVYWQTNYMAGWPALQALAKERRLEIPEWPMELQAHFRPEVEWGFADASMPSQVGASETDEDAAIL
jgi:hypothetical protein